MTLRSTGAVVHLRLKADQQFLARQSRMLTPHEVQQPLQAGTVPTQTRQQLPLQRRRRLTRAGAQVRIGRGSAPRPPEHQDSQQGDASQSRQQQQFHPTSIGRHARPRRRTWAVTLPAGWTEVGLFSQWARPSGCYLRAPMARRSKKRRKNRRHNDDRWVVQLSNVLLCVNVLLLFALLRPSG